MSASGSHRGERSEDQDISLFKAGVNADMFHFGPVVIAELVKSQAVQFGVDEGGQFGLQNGELSGIQKAFKNGILDALAVVHTFFGDLTQPFASGCSFGVDIVSDQNKHGGTSLPEEWRVKFQILAKRPRKKQCLHIGHESPGKLFLQERVGDLLGLFCLPGAEKGFPPLVRQKNSAVFLLLKVLGGQELLVDAGEDEAVCINGPQFFHEIQRKAPAAGPGAMQKTDVGVQSDTAEGGGTIAGQQRVGEGEQGIHIVSGRPAIPGSEAEIIVLLEDHGVKTVEISLCGFAFQTAELIRVFALLKKGQCSGQLSAGPLELFHRDPLRMIAGRPFQHPAGVVYFSQNEVPRIGTALGLAFRNAVLCLPEKDIAALFPDGAYQKLTVRAEKTQVDPVSGAFSHQGRAGSGTAETDDPFQCVKRDPADLGFLAGDNNIFAVQ